MYFSKSKYTQGIQCPKMLWMQQNMPEQFDSSVINESVLSTGNEVGDLAMGYYGPFVEVEFDPSNPKRFTKAAKQTQELIRAGEKIICEATFSIPGHFCMVDILRIRDDGSFDITEVKSSTGMKDTYLHDMAYQCWVVEQRGYAVASVSLMHVNSAYMRQGELDLQGLFHVEDCTDTVKEMALNVPTRVDKIVAVADAGEEPDIPIGLQCWKPYECGFRPWCFKELPENNVFDLVRMRKDKGLLLVESGCVDFDDLVSDPNAFDSLTDKQQLQILAEINNLPPQIDRAEIGAFLDSLWYPLYFLDFETFQEAIPSFDGQSPYEQVTSQYSLHWMDAPGATLQHTEFLGATGTDPRRQVAENLCRDIPASACVLAWNMGFEKGRIRAMAEMFPDLAPHLMAIHGNIRDLMTPFQKQHYYTRDMKGSSSIKKVLPSLFPDDPELDYGALEGIHNGSEAASAFQYLAELPPAEQEAVREQLLRYCELDTLAMVKIWERLNEVSA